MKKIEDVLDKDDKMQFERLEEMRKLILDQLKVIIKKKLEKTGE